MYIIKNQTNKSKNNAVVFSIFFILIVIFVCIKLYVVGLNIKSTKEIDNDKMTNIEIEYQKYYPIGNDFFKIVHSPKYSTFFEQFSHYNYYTTTVDNKVVGTCAIATLKNRLQYICDLKTNKNGSNLTFKFIFNHYFNLITHFKCHNLQAFGITMQPNKAIDTLVKKYFASKCCDLFLYQITYSQYFKNISLLNTIFGSHFCIEGYKKLVLKSTGTSINICHIATNSDLKYVKILQEPIDDISEYEIMFCLPSHSTHIKMLEMNDILKTSTMTIFSIFTFGSTQDWNFIKTYMI